MLRVGLGFRGTALATCTMWKGTLNVTHRFTSALRLSIPYYISPLNCRQHHIFKTPKLPRLYSGTNIKRITEYTLHSPNTYDDLATILARNLNDTDHSIEISVVLHSRYRPLLLWKWRPALQSTIECQCKNTFSHLRFRVQKSLACVHNKDNATTELRTCAAPSLQTLIPPTIHLNMVYIHAFDVSTP